MDSWNKSKYAVVVVPMVFSETLNQRIEKLRSDIEPNVGKVLSAGLSYNDGALVYIVEYLDKEQVASGAKKGAAK